MDQDTIIWILTIYTIVLAAKTVFDWRLRNRVEKLRDEVALLREEIVELRDDIELGTVRPRPDIRSSNIAKWED